MMLIGRIVVLAQCLIVSAMAGEIELISRGPASTPATAHGSSGGSVFSPDGKFVLFSSTAPDLINVPSDGKYHLYVMDRTTRVAQLVDADASGGLGNADAEAGGMSRDNRYVAFQSRSTDFGLTDTNEVTDVFIRDLTTGTTTLISHSTNGIAAGNGRSEFPQISEDGQWVVFQSAAYNLSAGDINNNLDIFAWKRADGSIRLVSAAPNGLSTNSEPEDFSLSADGKFVLFTASGTNLVVTNRVSLGDVYLRDLENETTRWVSAALTNLPGLGGVRAGNAVMSGNGRYVFFVAVPTPVSAPRVLVRVDLTDDSIIKVFEGFVAEPSQLDELVGPSVSNDGQFAAFATGTNIVRWSAATGATEVVVDGGISLDSRVSDTPVISHDGAKVAFLSIASDIVAGGGNGEFQLYVRDMVAGQTRLVTHDASGAATFGNDAAIATFSEDDSTVVFESAAGDLVLGDANNSLDVFTYNVADGALTLLSASRAEAPSLTVFGDSSVSLGSVSADGRYVVFRSLAKLNTNDVNQYYDVYLYDRTLQTNILISAGPDGLSMTNGNGTSPVISRDGNIVIFESNGQGMAGPTDTAPGSRIYARDLRTGSLRNISSTLTAGFIGKYMSANGRYVFFGSGGISAGWRYDLTDDTSIRLPTGALVNTSSADGSRFVYFSNNGLTLVDLAAGFTNRVFGGSNAMLSEDGSILVSASGRVLVTNLVTGETNGLPLGSKKPSIRADARIIAYELQPPLGTSDVYFFDRASGQNILISRALGKTTGGNGNSTSPVVSGDGRFIAFESWASDLVEGDANGLKDVFVYDRYTDRLTVASHALGATRPANSISVNPVISFDGKLLVFASAASDLIAGDLNDSSDVFATWLDLTIPTEDSDGDGLNDAWERASFSTLDFGGNDDPDGDGLSNNAELRAGTDPMNASSVLAIGNFEAATDGAAEIKFRGVAGRRYRIEFRPDLDATIWTQVGNEITASASGEISASMPSPQPGFYRIALVE